MSMALLRFPVIWTGSWLLDTVSISLYNDALAWLAVKVVICVTSYLKAYHKAYVLSMPQIVICAGGFCMKYFIRNMIWSVYDFCFTTIKARAQVVRGRFVSNQDRLPAQLFSVSFVPRSRRCSSR